MGVMSPTPASPSPAEPDAPAAAVPSPEVEGADGADAERPAQASHYAMTKKNSSVRNIVWALAVIMAFVVVLAMLFFGVGNDPDRSIPESSRLDVTASAERAAGVAPFPVIVPELSAQWTPRLAEYTGGADPRWELRYTAPSGALVTVIEQETVDAALLASAVPGPTVEDEYAVSGVPCQQLRGSGEAEGTRALSCQGEGWGILVHGDEDLDQLRLVAEASIADAQT